MKLYIVRHAWAEERDARRWPDDGDRPLTEAGRDRFARFVSRLREERGLACDLIAASPLVRCLHTAAILAECVLPRPVIESVAGLSCEQLDFDAVLRWTVEQVETHGRRAVAWVGHAPDVGKFVSLLAKSPPVDCRFSKGAICLLEFANAPRLRQGRLQWFLRAKDVGVDWT